MDDHIPSCANCVVVASITKRGRFSGRFIETEGKEILAWEPKCRHVDYQIIHSCGNTNIIITILIVMACRHIPTMTKSHHGGNVSVMIKLGMCQCQNPTIHDKVQLGPVGSGKLFKSAPVPRRNISAHFVNLTEPSINAYWK